jgi:hypothetical protein
MNFVHNGATHTLRFVYTHIWITTHLPQIMNLKFEHTRGQHCGGPGPGRR